MTDQPLVHIVKLGPRDWRELKAIRLDALAREPAAFAASYAEAAARTDEDWQQRLASRQSVHVMARMAETPIGMVGAYFGADGDESVAVVFGMYVNAKYRGRGVGRLLLRSLIAHVLARPEIVTIRLWVNEAQAPARRLYASFGFRVVGNTEGSMQDEDRSHDEVKMERSVRREELR